MTIKHRLSKLEGKRAASSPLVTTVVVDWGDPDTVDIRKVAGGGYVETPRADAARDYPTLVINWDGLEGENYDDQEQA